MLFCKAWHRLVYEQPELWRSLRVHVPESGSTTGGGSPAPPLRWLAGKLALRRRVGPLVSRLHLVGSGSVGVPPQLLPCLQQATLEELILTQPRELPPAMASTLTGFSGLHSLELAVLGTRPLPLMTTQAVAAAPGLRRLTLMAGRLQPALLRGCLAAQQLTLLELTSSDVPLPPLHPLTALTALRELSAFEWCSGAGGMRPLPLSAFPAIRRLAFRSTAFQVRLALRVCVGRHPSPSPACATACQAPAPAAPPPPTAFLSAAGRRARGALSARSEVCDVPAAYAARSSCPALAPPQAIAACGAACRVSLTGRRLGVCLLGAGAGPGAPAACHAARAGREGRQPGEAVHGRMPALACSLPAAASRQQ